MAHYITATINKKNIFGTEKEKIISEIRLGFATLHSRNFFSATNLPNDNGSPIYGMYPCNNVTAKRMLQDFEREIGGSSMAGYSFLLGLTKHDNIKLTINQGQKQKKIINKH